MRSVLITSFHPLVSRNILATPVPALLKSRGYRIILLVPFKKISYFKNHYSDVADEIIPIHTSLSWRDSLMRYLSLAFLQTATLDIKRRTEMKGRGAFLSRIIHGRAGILLLRFLEEVLPEKKRTDIEKAFNEFNPEICLSTDIQSELDVAILKAARRRRVRTVGMVRSWDNLTSKGLVRIVPQKLIVWNNLIKKEAVELNRIQEGRIAVVGIPHYDRYFNYKADPREVFLQSIGAENDKKFVLFIPIGDRYLSTNNVDLYFAQMLEKILPANFILFVRLPPGDSTRNLEQFLFSKKVYVERPVTAFKTLKNTELCADADRRLAETVYHSDVVITGPSTMVIDGAYFNKPMILEGFDESSKNYLDSIQRYYDYDNFLPVIRSGAARYPKNEHDFVNSLHEYIGNKNKDSIARHRFAELECAYLDGKSSERMVGSVCNT